MIVHVATRGRDELVDNLSELIALDASYKKYAEEK